MSTEINTGNFQKDVTPDVKMTDNDSVVKVNSLQDSILLYRSNKIFDILLDNIIFGYKDKGDYWLLLDEIYKLTKEDKEMKFLLPAFPAKSSNKKEKVLGVDVDFCESIAIDNLLSVARKIQSIYVAGVKFIIMSDYHTFDQYVYVDEDTYDIYHQGLKDMIRDKGADDVIELINLSHFTEFENVPVQEISKSLFASYGGKEFRETFDAKLKEEPRMLKRYTQQLKFCMKDLSQILSPLPPKKRKVNLKANVKGMMSQGVALDAFLRQQTNIDNYIRLSIHRHQPDSGKFAVDLFKNKCYVKDGAQLRTPWHNTVVLDTLDGQYRVDFKEECEKEDANTKTEVVYHNGKPWLYLKLHLNDGVSKEDLDLRFTLIKHSCGMIVESPKSNQTAIESLKRETVETLIQKFGILTFRGFKEFAKESDFLSFYENYLKQKPIKWRFGPVHKIRLDETMPGIVNSLEGLPLHWDLNAPPKYMGIDQDVHKYEDYVSPIFALYCRTFEQNHAIDENEADVNNKTNGATTFVDAAAAALSIHGETSKNWKQLVLNYETVLAEEDANGNELYFGGKKNTYKYPLIHQCPNQPTKDVIRWWQDWTKEEFPNSKQFNHFSIVSYPKELAQTTKIEVEKKIRDVVFDDRFFFSHQYKSGDLVFVNNYTTLHGRNPFNESVNRELWRIQSVPETDNVPEYFKQ